ncbi:MAG: SCP2 sterol-binding domain-containing protein [Gammaproteobacteria bacterium]|nr:SCP2 sterol-binding domain-containing protein [Gammaproteobacteria bacterium]
MSALFTALIEASVNRVLRLDPDTLQRLAPLTGKVIHLRLTGAPAVEIFVLPSATGLQIVDHHSTEPDVTLAGDIPIFGRLMLRPVLPDIAAAGELKISGDIELGSQFQQIMKNIDIDWEEQTARVAGDVMAHQLGNTLRGLRQWSQQAWRTVGDNTVEYWQEESRALPTRFRVDAWRESVQTLQNQTDSLAQRIERLREKIK